MPGVVPASTATMSGTGTDSPRKPKPRLAGVREGDGRTGVLSRLHALFPRHGSSVNSPPPVDEPQQPREAPYEHSLKIRIISWNMNDTLPKGNLDALLGEVPPYNTADGQNPAAANFELGDTAHPYNIIVVAGQECPTGLLPMGMGAVKMDRKDKDKSKPKQDDPSPKSKSSRPRRSEEEEYQLLDPGFQQPSSASLQHTSGWSALLEDWLCKSRNIGVAPDGSGVIPLPSSPMSERNPLPPPSPTPSRSPSLPPASLAEVKKAAVGGAGMKVPPSPRRMNTFLNGHGLSHSNGHTAWNDPAATKPYVLVAKERLMGIYLAVYVHRETRPLVRGVSKSSVTAGLIGGRLGNKGGVGISLNIAGRSFLFVNAHLAAHEGRQALRIENMEKIQAELRVDNFGEALYPRKPIPDKSDITDAFDYTFICGDLNFRLDVSRLHADWMISRHEYLQAQEFDELRNNMRSNKLFPGFEEPVIDFPPTFKYDVPKIRHHKEKDRGVRASIRAARRSKRKKDKEKDKDKLQTPKTPNKTLRPLAEQIESAQAESGGSSSDVEEEHDEDESDADSYTSSQHLHSQSQPNLKLRPMSMRSQPTQAGSTSDGESASDEAASYIPDGGGAAGLGRMLSRSAKKGWRVLVVKAGAGAGAGKKGPDVVLTGSSLSVGALEVEKDKAKSQPNLVIDTAVDPVAAGGMLSPVPGTAIMLSPTDGRLAPPPMIRGNSSAGSSMGASGEAGAEAEDESARGVYDTSSKQRVPSWCDRIVYKSTVLPPEPPPSLTLPPFSASLTDEDSQFVGRLSNIFTGIRRRGSRGRKDSFPVHIRARKEALAETRASPFLKQPGAGDDEDGAGNKPNAPKPVMGGQHGNEGSRAGAESPPSMQWPRTNPFAKLLHPNLHNSQNQHGPGLIHAVSMEPEPQPPAGLGLPRPRSLSTSEGEAPPPVAPPKDESRWWFFNRRQSEPPEPPPPAEPEPQTVEQEEHKRGDIVCLSYGTLDDRAMQRLGGRSDHRPVLGTYAVYI
ncbi:phosphoglycerate mutase family protein [Ceratobasidium sp. AG-Ba]|nr:phosphoglycerate mutase family protein [Ceratobasidium sp. AG-Ba]